MNFYITHKYELKKVTISEKKFVGIINKWKDVKHTIFLCQVFIKKTLFTFLQATFQIYYWIGWKPGKNQPKPLAPHKSGKINNT